MSKCYIKLETPNSNEYFVSIIDTNVKTSPDINEALLFDTLASAVALINYVLPKPLIGSWKVVQHGTI